MVLVPGWEHRRGSKYGVCGGEVLALETPGQLPPSPSSSRPASPLSSKGLRSSLDRLRERPWPGARCPPPLARAAAWPVQKVQTACPGSLVVWPSATLPTALGFPPSAATLPRATIDQPDRLPGSRLVVVATCWPDSPEGFPGPIPQDSRPGPGSGPATPQVGQPLLGRRWPACW